MSQLAPSSQSAKAVRPVLATIGIYFSIFFAGWVVNGSALAATRGAQPVKAPTVPQPPVATVPRPPQYIAFAFDGSKSVPMWQDSRAFAKQMTAAGKPLKFTYFINADYYLANQYKMSYIAPGLGAGKSAIGFGEKVTDVSDRFDQTNLAYQDGNEIANHAAGHFDGSKWSAAEWTSEFDQFYDIIFNVFKFNHSQPTHAFPKGWTFDKSEIIGFRAPQLGQNAALFATLPKYGMQYDTSLTAQPNYWPRKNAQGLWNFPLATIAIAGTAKHTLSMDYNFFYSQSGAKEDAARSSVYEDQMYRSYVAYFQQNYNGNRAPINIGHHFAQWNAGAYWRAEKHLIQTVCGMPEVKCVTYRDLVAFMNKTDPATIAAYSAGRFEKLTPVKLADAQLIDLRMGLAKDESGELTTYYAGLDAEALLNNESVQTFYTLNNKKIEEADLTIAAVRAATPLGETATIEGHMFAGTNEIQFTKYNVNAVGTMSESVTEAENPAMINDPPQAHDEYGADDVAKFSAEPSQAD